MATQAVYIDPLKMNSIKFFVSALNQWYDVSMYNQKYYKVTIKRSDLMKSSFWMPHDSLPLCA